MVTPLADGRHAFRIFLPHAASVKIVGSFTDWKARCVSMVRHAPGWWEALVEIPQGRHEFAYLVDNSIWLADYAAGGVKLTGYSGWVSILEVHPDPAQVETKPNVMPAKVA
jgi:1,4-alpha-glucan branching enzyme